MNKGSAIKAVNEAGILLVFPIKNHPEVPSLWSTFYPKTKMRWEWDDSGDSRVVKLWHLRAELSSSYKVVYSKWFQGRATLFSLNVFSMLLSKLHHGKPSSKWLSLSAKKLLEILDDNSPQSTKALKTTARKELNWETKEYDRAMKELWQSLLIVGVGEVDDGAFPSLNVGSTRLMFEDIWQKANTKDWKKFSLVLEKYLTTESPWLNQFARSEKMIRSEHSLTSKQNENVSKTKSEKNKKKILRYEDIVKS